MNAQDINNKLFKIKKSFQAIDYSGDQDTESLKQLKQYIQQLNKLMEDFIKSSPNQDDINSFREKIDDILEIGVTINLKTGGQTHRGATKKRRVEISLLDFISNSSNKIFNTFLWQTLETTLFDFIVNYTHLMPMQKQQNLPQELATPKKSILKKTNFEPDIESFKSDLPTNLDKESGDNIGEKALKYKKYEEYKSIYRLSDKTERIFFSEDLVQEFLRNSRKEKGEFTQLRQDKIFDQQNIGPSILHKSAVTLKFEEGNHRDVESKEIENIQNLVDNKNQDDNFLKQEITFDEFLAIEEQAKKQALTKKQERFAPSGGLLFLKRLNKASNGPPPNTKVKLDDLNDLNKNDTPTKS